MPVEVIEKMVKNRRTGCPYSRSVNLYRFIRLILGPGVPNYLIARRWGMDQKNFSQFKSGKTPVPRLERLEQLARLLGVNKHLVYEVAGGASADKVFKLIRKNDLSACRSLLGVGRPGQRSPAPSGDKIIVRREEVIL